MWEQTSGLLVPFCVTWLKPRCFLVPVFSHLVIFYFCCLFIPKASCFRDRSTFCIVFKLSGPKSLNSSEVSEFSGSADNVLLYASDYRGEDHRVVFLSLNVLPDIGFSSHSHLYIFKIPFQFWDLLMRSPAKFSSRYCHAPLKFYEVFYTGKTGFG